MINDDDKGLSRRRRAWRVAGWTAFGLLLAVIQIGAFVSMANPANWAPVVSWSGE